MEACWKVKATPRARDGVKMNSAALLTASQYSTQGEKKMSCLEIKDELLRYRSNTRLQYHFIAG